MDNMSKPMPKYTTTAVRPARWSAQWVLRRFVIPDMCDAWLKNVYHTKYPDKREGFILELVVDSRFVPSRLCPRRVPQRCAPRPY